MKQQEKISYSFLLNWGYRGYNGLVAALVIYQYLNNPNASAIEYGVDVMIHTLEAVAPDSLKKVAVAGNAFRMAQAGIGIFSGTTTIDPVANAADTFNHLMNLGHRLSK